jgi:hypothetical protein
MADIVSLRFSHLPSSIHHPSSVIRHLSSAVLTSVLNGLPPRDPVSSRSEPLMPALGRGISAVALALIMAGCGGGTTGQSASKPTVPSKPWLGEDALKAEMMKRVDSKGFPRRGGAGGRR